MFAMDLAPEIKLMITICQSAKLG